MTEIPASHGEVLEQSLAGRKLYSPAVIAVYTIVANLPMGCILYGLNLRARGQRRLALLALWSGAIGLGLLMLLALGGIALPFAIAIGVCGAINVYKLESRPFERALRDGAIRARWWPPALWLLVALGLLALVQYLIYP
jgi:hypothetical protein